jgi:GT2 family glycosyltransferase
MKTKVGLVTVTYNSEKDIEEFLTSCSTQTHQDIILYVVDNDSSDQSLKNIREFKNKKDLSINVFEMNKNMGISYGNNFGIKKAISDKCDWIILINNDTAFGPDLVSSLINGDSMVNVPLITYYGDKEKIWFYKGFFNKYKGFTGTHFMKDKELQNISNSEIEFTQYSPTCCMAIKKEIFHEVGLMDEDFFVYFDDTDFTYRLFKHQVKIEIKKDVILNHKIGSSSGGVMSDFTIEATSKNRIIFMRKHFNLFYTALNLPIFLVFYFIRFLIIKRSYKKFKISIFATYEGLTTNLNTHKYCD